MNIDERVFGLVERKRVVAVGVRFFDRPDYLVGVYRFWKDADDSRRFLSEIVRVFGEAKLYSPEAGCLPGLVCKMVVDVPSLTVVDDSSPSRYLLKLDLLEMRASNPKPFLALRYDPARKLWTHTPLPALRCVNSNYSYIPN